MRDQFLALRRLEVPEERLGLFHGHRRQDVDIRIRNRDGQRLRFEAGALARLAGCRRHILLDLFLDVVRRGLAVTTLQVLDDALELRLVTPLAPTARFVDEALLVFGTVQPVSYTHLTLPTI